MSEVESEDVIRLIMQYLRDCQLTGTLRELRRESGVTLGALDEGSPLFGDILHGRWESVLPQLTGVDLSGSLACDLYEQIVLELIEMHEGDLARALLAEAPPLKEFAIEYPEKRMQLEHWARRGARVDPKDMYPPGSNKEKRREELSAAVKKEVAVVPPGKLLAIIGQALKWQQVQGLLPKGQHANVFRCVLKTHRSETKEKPCKRQVGQIKFGAKSAPEMAVFSPDGQSLATGTADGFIELWDPDTERLRKDLEYQARDELMMHDDSVLCGAFSIDGELLATGCNAGCLKVWKVSTGQCLRRFDKAHGEGIVCATFSRDGSQVLTGSFDCTARVHGLKSGKTLKELRGHTSYVNSVCYAAEGTRVVTGSSDGVLRVWDSRSAECLTAYRPGEVANDKFDASANDSAIQTILPLPMSPGESEQRILICAQGPALYMFSLSGAHLRTFERDTAATGEEFNSACISPLGRFAYAIAQDGKLCIFNLLAGVGKKGGPGDKEERLVVIDVRQGGGEVMGVSHHPHRNLIATYGKDGLLKLWKP